MWIIDRAIARLCTSVVSVFYQGDAVRIWSTWVYR